MTAPEFPRWLCRIYSSPSKKKSFHNACRPSVEALESRYAPAVYRITTLTDGAVAPTGGTGTAANPFTGATLRGALNDINANHTTEANIVQLTAGATYTLSNGQLNADLAAGGSLVILPVGVGRATIERDDNSFDFRIFEFSPDTLAELRTLRIHNGELNNFGGDAIGAGILNRGVLTLRNTEVSGNNAVTFFGSAMGGGIFNEGRLALVGSVVSGNTAVSGAFQFDRQPGAARGGGIANRLPDSNFQPSLSLTNSVVTGNEVRSKFAGTAFGGGISDEGGSPISIYTSTVSKNQAIGGPGGFFSNEEADLNGGEARGGGFATGFGRGGSTVTVVNSTFSGNSAFGGDSDETPGGNAFGGGLDLRNYSVLRMINCTISGNLAQGGQGAIDDGPVQRIGPLALIIINGIGQGGGIYHLSTGVRLGHLINLTITQNQALNDVDPGNGGGIFNNPFDNIGKPLRVWNTIIAQNFINVARNEAVAGSDVSGSYLSNSALYSGNNLIGNRLGSTGFGGVGSHDIVGPPLVSAGVNPLAFNGGLTQTHLLQTTSRAVNAGNDAVLSYFTALGIALTDQRGLPRKSGLHVDIGAVELPIAITSVINRRWDR